MDHTGKKGNILSTKQTSSKLRSKQPIGIKNIGNTCFLNTTIQFLFSASKFKIALIKHTSKNNTQFSTLIGKIFSFLEERSKEKERIIDILQKMVKQIQSLNLQYSCYSQEDALETLLNILFEIQESYPQILQNFEVQCMFECDCQSNIVADKILLYSSMVCARCRKKIKRTILNFPSYIIFSNSNKVSASKEIIEMTEIDSQAFEFIYSLKSQIIYSGNGRSGHYFSLRHEEDQSYILDDENVIKINKGNIQHYGKYAKTGLILLYQLKEKRKVAKKDNRNGQLKSSNQAIKHPNSSNILSNKQNLIIGQKIQQSQRWLKDSRNQSSSTYEQNKKINLSFIYCFRISVIDKISYDQTTDKFIFRNTKKDCYVKFSKKIYYAYQLLNKEQFPYYYQCDFSHQFDKFYECHLKQYDNQLQMFGSYLQSYLQFY